MAKLPSQFNSDDHEEMGDFSPLPNGEYVVKISDSDYKQNKNKTGHYLQLIREVCEGDYKGRKVYSNLNLDNPNPVTVEIAQKELTSTCKACGVVSVEDSEELHGIEHIVKLGIKKGDKDNPDSNKILSIKPLDGVSKPANPTKSATSDKKPVRKKPVFED